MFCKISTSSEISFTPLVIINDFLPSFLWAMHCARLYKKRNKKNSSPVTGHQHERWEGMTNTNH
jgi:hypothetical protein